MSSPTFLINFSAPHLGPQMEWISSTLSENNHTFLVCCGLWHEKPTFVASCGLMCPQNHTCVGRCGLVVASHACFPCKKSHPDIQIRGPLGIFVTLDKAANRMRRREDAVGIWRLPNTGTALEPRLAPTRLQIRFPILGRCLMYWEEMHKNMPKHARMHSWHPITSRAT